MANCLTRDQSYFSGKTDLLLNQNLTPRVRKIIFEKPPRGPFFVPVRKAIFQQLVMKRGKAEFRAQFACVLVAQPTDLQRAYFVGKRLPGDCHVMLREDKKFRRGKKKHSEESECLFRTVNNEKKDKKNIISRFLYEYF